MPSAPALLLALMTCLYSGFIWADADPITVEHYQTHERYQYGEQLLGLALSKLDQEFEIRTPNGPDMNEARGELEVISGNLDLEWMSTTSKRESKMIPVKIPIYRWILGLRLLLVQQERALEISQIQDLKDLQLYTGTHGKHWGDLPVYAANNLKVEALVKYENLFTLIEIGRADYFHRGLNEIWSEYEQHREKLAIADNVMLFYPLPVYYFVNKDRPELAAQIEKGLILALEDGSFKEHFLNYHAEFIEKGELEKRRLIALINPDLPKGTPAVDRSWWLPTP
jgi:hypothetical protein